MKCLLCSFESQDENKLLEHYLTYHNIDSKNCFFQKLFQSDNRPFFKNCIRCKQFLTSWKEKATHDFLKHYSDSKHNPVFTILFQKSSNEYCYCFNRVQLGQYWRCVCENQKLICPKKCNIFDAGGKRDSVQMCTTWPIQQWFHWLNSNFCSFLSKNDVKLPPSCFMKSRSVLRDKLYDF